MSDDRVELKPCPYPICGSTEVELVDFMKEGSEDRWHRVECRECGARGPEIMGCSIRYYGAVQIDEYRKEAIRAWNTRVPAVQDEGMVAKVKDAIRGAASRLPGMTLDDELSDSEVTNAAKAAIQAMSLYGS